MPRSELLRPGVVAYAVRLLDADIADQHVS